MSKIISDVNKLELDQIIELFELDLSTGLAETSEDIFRWHAGLNDNLQDIIWQGNIYTAFPIEATGFEFTGKGMLPRPKLTVANITTALSAILKDYDDLIGAKVTRKRTFAKYLDAYCYISGSSLGGWCTDELGGGDASTSKSDCEDATKNLSAGTWYTYTASICGTNSGTWYASGEADDTAEFTDEIWYIDRKSVETNTHIEFELSSAHDVQGVKLPSRYVISNLCPWVYKGTGCNYDGDSYFDINNEGTDSAGDVCAKTFAACELRFPEPQEMPFGGFPGAGIKMGKMG